MYWTYLLENSQGKIYIGSTSNIENRVRDHNEKGNRWTSSYENWNLIYKEKFETRSEAMKREKFLKSLKAGQRIKQILQISPD